MSAAHTSIAPDQALSNYERWMSRKCCASRAPRPVVSLASSDVASLRWFGFEIASYLNQVDEPDHGGWILVDDPLVDLLLERQRATPGAPPQPHPRHHLIGQIAQDGGAVIACRNCGNIGARNCRSLNVLLATEQCQTDGSPGGEHHSALDLNEYHAIVQTHRLPKRIVVGAIADAVIEWSSLSHHAASRAPAAIKGWSSPRSAKQIGGGGS